MPMELSAVKKKTMVRTGMACIRPPYSEISRVWRRS